MLMQKLGHQIDFSKKLQGIDSYSDNQLLRVLNHSAPALYISISNSKLVEYLTTLLEHLLFFLEF